MGRQVKKLPVLGTLPKGAGNLSTRERQRNMHTRTLQPGIETGTRHTAGKKRREPNVEDDDEMDGSASGLCHW